MKLIQMNAWHWRLYWPLRRFFEREQPDFILAQESVDAEWHHKSDHFTSSGIVAEGLMQERLQCPGERLGIREGVTQHIGSAILANHPLTQIAIVDMYGPDEIAKDHNLAEHQLLHATTGVNGQILNLITYHNRVVVDLSLPHEGRLGTPESARNFQKVGRYLDGVKGPTIFTGDFNLWPTAPVLQPVKDHGLVNLVEQHGFTVGRNELAWKTDEIVSHVFVSPEIEVQDFRMATDLVSDHQPLVLEFEI